MVRTGNILPWFGKDADHILFHATIDAWKNHFSGLMVIKFLNPESCRVVYLTEVGIKIFDLEFFRNGDFKVHYCLEAINRKSVINILKNDLGLMLNNIPEESNSKYLENKLNGKILLKTKDQAGTKYYLLNDKRNRVEEIFLKKSLQNKINIKFWSGKEGELDSVRISHYNVKLDIQLSIINNLKSDVPQ